MATFNGASVFGSGPTRIVPVTTEAEIRSTRFPGLQGEHHLNMGRAGGSIRQEGTLVAASAAGMKSAINALRACVGQRGTLVDDFAFSYYNCTVVSVAFPAARQTDPQGNHYLDYVIEYRQALSSIV